MTVHVGFIGFGNKSKEEVEIILEPEYQLAFKALNKKDTVTKLKALQELSVLFKAITDDKVNSVLKVWTQCYVKIALDDDRRVREATNQCFITLIRSVKKSFAPHIKSLFGIWLLNLFDPCKEVQVAARNALNCAINTNKQTDAIIFCKKEIMNVISNNLEMAPPSTTLLNNSDPDTSLIINERYERLVSCSLNTLSFMINTLPLNENITLLPLYQDVTVLNNKFWNVYFTYKSGIVRKSCYHFITVTSLKLPQLLENYVEKLSNLIYNMLNDKDGTVHQEMWECLLTYCNQFPNVWSFVKFNNFNSKLYSLLRDAGYSIIGCPFTYISLLPLIAQLPLNTFENLPQFINDFLNNLLKGLQSENINKQQKILIQSYVECLKYFYLHSKQHNLVQLQFSLFNNHYFNLIHLFISPSSVISNNSNNNNNIDLNINDNYFVSIISDTYNKISNNISNDEQLDLFWSNLTKLLIDLLNDTNNSNLIKYRIGLLLTTLYEQEKQQEKSRNKIIDCIHCLLPIITTNSKLIEKQESIYYIQLYYTLLNKIPLTVLTSKDFSSYFQDELLPWVQSSLKSTVTISNYFIELFKLCINYLSVVTDTVVQVKQWEIILQLVLNLNNFPILTNLIDQLPANCNLNLQSTILTSFTIELIDQLKLNNNNNSNDIKNLLILLQSIFYNASYFYENNTVELLLTKLIDLYWYFINVYSNEQKEDNKWIITIKTIGIIVILFMFIKSNINKTIIENNKIMEYKLLNLIVISQCIGNPQFINSNNNGIRIYNINNINSLDIEISEEEEYIVDNSTIKYQSFDFHLIKESSPVAFVSIELVNQLKNNQYATLNDIHYFIQYFTYCHSLLLQNNPIFHYSSSLLLFDNHLTNLINNDTINLFNSLQLSNEEFDTLYKSLTINKQFYLIHHISSLFTYQQEQLNNNENINLLLSFGHYYNCIIKLLDRFIGDNNNNNNNAIITQYLTIFSLLKVVMEEEEEVKYEGIYKNTNKKTQLNYITKEYEINKVKINNILTKLPNEQLKYIVNDLINKGNSNNALNTINIIHFIETLNTDFETTSFVINIIVNLIINLNLNEITEIENKIDIWIDIFIAIYPLLSSENKTDINNYLQQQIQLFSNKFENKYAINSIRFIS